MKSLSAVIVGGGLGGLALAQSLKKHHIDFVVCEREQEGQFLQTGYRIKINDNGMSALRFCLPEKLYDLFMETSVMGPEHPIFLNPISLELMEEQHPMYNKAKITPGVNRFTFREVLLGELNDHIRYGYRFTHYETLENGRLRAWFENGEYIDADVLVGADGGGSKVRQQYKPGVKIFDTLGRALYTKVFLDDTRRKELDQLIGDGSMRGLFSPEGEAPVSLLLEEMAFKPNMERLPESMSLNVKITPQQDYLYAVFACSPEWFGMPDEQLFQLNGSELLSLAQEKTKHWHPQVKRMLELAEPEKTAVYHLRNVLPYKPWKETTSLVLLGDALHPMTPAGIGGNAALFDAYELSKELINVKDGKKELLSALRDYEVAAIERGMRDVRLSSKAGESMFNQKPLPEEDVELEE
ncbi:FAD binding domain protein [Paenibacillus sp. oral taxon 786 str. D14]|uniref:FAD-dependent oxidoreductase n=1 Tax=unclassified Paenibacillus TaxID=185978 RepID=UPI0001AFD34B|nr:FAD-dependent monooxygenase [Paenibacillus sp. oral taxon 786]EES74398.1 FAD binding domain protein [Paenibacillus sp. oral taxon 786 str. D14]